MKNIVKKIIAASLVACIWPSTGVCSSAITTRVLQVGTYGNGNLFILFDKPIDEAGCAITSFELNPTSPAFKSVLATATLAFAASAIVEVKTDGCFMGSPTFSGARAAYIVVKQ